MAALIRLWDGFTTPPTLEFISASSCTCANVTDCNSLGFCSRGGNRGRSNQEAGVRPPSLIGRGGGGGDVPPQPLVFVLVQLRFPRATISESLLWRLRLLLYSPDPPAFRRQAGKTLNIEICPSLTHQREREKERGRG